jgi:ABC-type glycerol-3-phosphate transport system permease component
MERRLWHPAALGSDMMAGAVLAVAPVLLLFVALQRYYIEGILLGSVKE